MITERRLSIVLATPASYTDGIGWTFDMNPMDDDRPQYRIFRLSSGGWSGDKIMHRTALRRTRREVKLPREFLQMFVIHIGATS